MRNVKNFGLIKIVCSSENAAPRYGKVGGSDIEVSFLPLTDFT